MWTNENRADSDDAPEVQVADQPYTEIGRGLPSEADIGMMIRIAREHITRDRKKMIDTAKQVGGLLGEDGFYRFPAGGNTIEDGSIDLAQALAQEWGGILYEVQIIDAKPLPHGGQRVHLRARVVDLVTIVFVSTDQVISTSQPPGKFAKKPDQIERWNTMQVQSAASKIMRNAINRILPDWFKKAGLDAAMAVADNEALGTKDGKRRTLPEARAGAVEQFAKAGIMKAELESYVGQPFDLWAVPQIHQLMVLYRDLANGRTSIEAFRASLGEREPVQTNGNGKQANGSGARQTASATNALGLPARTAGQTVDEAMKASGAGEQQREPVAADPKPADDEQQQSLGAEQPSSKAKAR